MQKKNGIAALLLAFALFLSFSACGPAPENETEPAPETAALPILSEEAEQLYSTVLSFELGELLDLCPAGDGWLLSAEEGIYTLDADLTLLPEREPISTYGIVMTEDGDGPLWMTYAESEPGYILRDRERERYSIDPGHGLPGTQVLALNGSVWICDGYRLLRDGTELELPEEPGYLRRAASLVKTSEGLFAVLVRTEEASQNNLSARLVPVGADTVDLREAEGRELPEAFQNVEPLCAPESGCLYADGKLWRLENERIRLLADLQTYGVNPSALRRVLLDGDRILCLESDGLMVLSSEPPAGPSAEDPAASSEPPAERATLRVGVLGYECPDLQKLVSYVNRSGSCARLETKVYADAEQLNLAVLSGEVDLLSAGDLSLLQNYAQKDLLLPVDQLLPELFSSGILYENMVDALRCDGHCYYLPPCYVGYVNLLPKRYETDPASLDSISALEALLAEKEPEYFDTLTKESVLAGYWLPVTIDYWVDRDAGTARFDTEEFVEFLNFCDRYSLTWEEVVANQAGMDGSITPPPHYRMELTMSIGPSDQYKDYDYYRLPYEGLSTISLSSECYLAAVRDTDPTQAGSFFSVVLTDEGWHEKGRIGGNSGSINPHILFLNREWTEADLDKTEQDTLEAYAGTYKFDPEEFKTAMEKIRGFLNEANHFEGNLSELIDVILEEANAFFNGDITAEEAARRIQNRVEIYLAERG